MCNIYTWDWVANECFIVFIQNHRSEFYISRKYNVSRPVWLGVRHPSGTRDQFFFLLKMFFRQLSVCYFVAPSLTSGRVCNLLLLLVLASAVPLGSESRGTQDHILLPQFLRLPQPGGPGPRIYIPRNRVVQIYPRALGWEMSTKKCRYKYVTEYLHSFKPCYCEWLRCRVSQRYYEYVGPMSILLCFQMEQFPWRIWLLVYFIRLRATFVSVSSSLYYIYINILHVKGVFPLHNQAAGKNSNK
jgi:hypothetical protein